MVNHDSSGRRQRLTPESTGKRITLQERDWLWLRMIHEHGPLSSSFLLQFAKGLGSSEKRAKERLTDLFNEDNTVQGGTYLSRPPQQFQTLDSRYNQLVYDLTPAARKALQENELWQVHSVSAGPWVHRFMVSSVTASIHLATKSTDHLSYIPQSTILARAETELAYPIEAVYPGSTQSIKKQLKPDAIFGLEYNTKAGNRYRFFVVEADRSTEPYTSRNFNRKSVLTNFLQYRQYIGHGLYKQHLNLTAPLLVLNVCTDKERTARIIKLIEAETEDGNAFMLFQSWTDFGSPFRPPSPNANLLLGEWERAGRVGVRIGDV